MAYGDRLTNRDITIPVPDGFTGGFRVLDVLGSYVYVRFRSNTAPLTALIHRYHKTTGLRDTDWSITFLESILTSNDAGLSHGMIAVRGLLYLGDYDEDQHGGNIDSKLLAFGISSESRDSSADLDIENLFIQPFEDTRRGASDSNIKQGTGYAGGITTDNRLIWMTTITYDGVRDATLGGYSQVITGRDIRGVWNFDSGDIRTNFQSITDLPLDIRLDRMSVRDGHFYFVDTALRLRALSMTNGVEDRQRRFLLPDTRQGLNAAQFVIDGNILWAPVGTPYETTAGNATSWSLQAYDLSGATAKIYIGTTPVVEVRRGAAIVDELRIGDKFITV